MRRVLWLAYYFPPIGGAGVQRSVKFVRYLGELNWAPVVVTGPGDAVSRWAPRDETLADEIPARTVVCRVPGPEPSRSTGWRGRSERWLRQMPAFERWWIDGSVELGRTHASSTDLIYASMSPYASGAAAAALARETGLPWVADLRDPWALDEMQVYPTAAHRRLELARMRRVLSSASAIVMNTPAARAALLAYAPELSRRHVVSIPNGYDAADFASACGRRSDNVFRIVHSGYLHTADGLGQRHRLLGGGVVGTDLLTRSHVYLLKALDRLITTEPTLAGTIELHLAGVSSAVDRAVADRPYVRFRGYLDHAETIELVRTADLLFLPMQNLPPGRRATITPGKTYEYVASGRPILAAVPEGDARDLLIEAGTASLCAPDDDAAMTAAVGAAVAAWRSGVEPLPVPSTLLARYERRRLTRDLADVFGAAAGSS